MLSGVESECVKCLGAYQGAWLLLIQFPTNVHLTVTTERLVRLDSDTGSVRPLPKPGHIGTGQNI